MKPKAQRCGLCKSDTDCEDNLTCTGASATTSGHCFAIIGMLGECDSKCSRCDEYLTCKHGVCIAHVMKY